MSFRAWLLSQTDRDDPIGDLARDVRHDRGSRARTVRGVRQRILNVGGCDAAVDALEAAAREWRSNASTK